MKTSNIVILLIILILIALGVYFLFFQRVEPQASTAALSTAPAGSEIQGMKIEILKEGTGEGAKAGDDIVVNYVGTLPDGTKFDSSIDRGQPFAYTLGQNQVIQGWELGLLGMKVGEKRKLTIPPELGYGSQGAGGVIPPNTTLTFEIDMLSINGK